MSKLEKLIAKHCPDGVEYRTLGDVLSIKNGKNHKGFAAGAVPVYGTGGIMTYIDTFVYDKPSVLIPRKGSLEKLYYVDVPFWTVDTIFWTEIDTKLIIPKFAFYYLQKQHLENLNMAGGVPSLTQTILNKVQIPLPPLPVQREIVRILDNFTELTAELTAILKAELEARKKQYEFYRDTLLNFDSQSGKIRLESGTAEQRNSGTAEQRNSGTAEQRNSGTVEHNSYNLHHKHAGGVIWTALGEIGEFYGGLTGKSKEDFRDGNARYITYMNIFSNIAVNLDLADHVKVGEKEKQRSVRTGDILFTGSSETPGECGMSSVVVGEVNEPIYLNSFCFGFRFQDTSMFLPEFTKYLFRCNALRRQIIKTASGVTRFNVSKEKMKKVLVPLPSLAEQARIVKILDKFDALTTDLTSGLPAEIEARKKQYEYYRDTLLTFKEKKA